MAKKSQLEIEKFAVKWLDAHAFIVRDAQGVETEVGRLSAEITRDARAEGIRGSDLHSALGDIDDYLARGYGKMQEPGG